MKTIGVDHDDELDEEELQEEPPTEGLIGMNREEEKKSVTEDGDVNELEEEESLGVTQ